MDAAEQLERRRLRDVLYAAAAAGDLNDLRPDELERAGLDYATLELIASGEDEIAWQNDITDEPLRWWRDDVEPPPGFVLGDADAPPRTPIVRGGVPMYLSRCGDLLGLRPPEAVVVDDADPRDRWY
ncbi:hypothetical protein Cch01nite_31760 [Cellulomonas chitinilytica]|uniref:Uncharacterized protein n=1 Tax=Cellulomonas chitinilytica TaxID=398759 RepID=A0A919P348_9CELL|nr:hypothetical protein [Cellulomonas chitinilytica]GIG22452.1 hypothetical protein Cch01nite_31760 [Cellulomonas chitinilytica]